MMRGLKSQLFVADGRSPTYKNRVISVSDTEWIMKFKVTGTSKSTGARMTLEFEAESKGAAERKAMQQGMNVTRAENISEGEMPKSYPTGADQRRAKSGGSLVGKLMTFIILAAIALSVWHFWPQIMQLVSKK
jgi:hypothetical protein